MIGLDTNVLVRYITKDNEQQWKKAVQLIESGQPCFISNIVLCELVWVLRSQPYHFKKEEILQVLEVMLQTPVFQFENRSVVYSSLQRTKQGRADFSDYLIGTLAQQAVCNETATFDRKLNEEKGFNYLIL